MWSVVLKFEKFYINNFKSYLLENLQCLEYNEKSLFNF